MARKRKKITNDRSFSFSAARAFDECSRRWWLQKIGSWEGWNGNATSLQKHAYRGKNMQNVWTLAGDVVHQMAVTQIRFKHDPEALVERYVGKMRAGWIQAKREADLLFSGDPKNAVNLHELFYTGTNIDDLDGYAVQAFERGRTCVENIFQSEGFLMLKNGGKLIEQEQLHSFFVDDVKVWVQLDLMFDDKSGTRWVWDWKTGKPSEKDEKQLGVYALYVDSLGIDVADVMFGLAYLATGEDQVHTFTAARLEGLRDEIRTESGRIFEQLTSKKYNEAPPENFLRTDDLERCKRCELFFACKGHCDLTNLTHIESGFER